MSTKYFQVSKDKNTVSQEAIEQIERDKSNVLLNDWQQNFTNFQLELAKKKDDVVPVEGRVLVVANIHSKSTHRFANGQEISIIRDVDNFNRRQTQPVNGIVLQSENIPSGSEVIMHHNAIDPNNELFNYSRLGEQTNNVKYLAIPETQCFLYREPNSITWMPCKGFETGMNCFMPYIGFMIGIKPKQLKNRILATSGEHKGKVCVVATGSAYPCIFQGLDGREETIIRFRNFDGKDYDRMELWAIDEWATNLYNEGKLLAGLTADNCKLINE